MQRGRSSSSRPSDQAGSAPWAYRCRLDGRDARRVQRGGYANADEAHEALQRALAAAQRPATRARDARRPRRGVPRAARRPRPRRRPSSAGCWPRPPRPSARRSSTELDAREIAAWRMTLPTGHRFEATQALRQTLARAVDWGLMEPQPSHGRGRQPQPPRREMRPFDSEAQLEALAAQLGPAHGPMILFAAATGLRPGEWFALEHRNMPRRPAWSTCAAPSAIGASRAPRPTPPRAAPLQRSALEALDPLRRRGAHRCSSPRREGGYLDVHNFRSRRWRPAQRAASVDPARRLDDLRDPSPPSPCGPASAPSSSRPTWAPA